MPNKGNYVNLAFAAAKHAGNLRQLQAALNNASNIQKNAVARFWESKIKRDGNNIHRRMNNLGLTVNRFRRGTPEYYSTLVNLSLAKSRN